MRFLRGIPLAALPSRNVSVQNSHVQRKTLFEERRATESEIKGDEKQRNTSIRREGETEVIYLSIKTVSMLGS